MLTPSDQIKQGAFDLMLNMVTQNYQSDPTTKYHSECSGSSQSCIRFLVPNDGSGDYYFQHTLDNSINWWSQKLSAGPYLSLVTYAEWFHYAETLPDPGGFVAVGFNSCQNLQNPGTANATLL